jgi:uncharacterized protein YicC (UPF0701 family)
MTGFGRGQGSAAGLEFTVELKAVNSRYFEFSCRLPRGYLFLEDKQQHPMPEDQYRQMRKNLVEFYRKIKPPWISLPPGIRRDEEPP